MSDPKSPEDPCNSDFLERLPEDVRLATLAKRKNEQDHQAKNITRLHHRKVWALILGVSSYAILSPAIGKVQVPFVFLMGLSGALTANIIVELGVWWALGLLISGGIASMATTIGIAMGWVHLVPFHIPFVFVAYCAIGSALSKLNLNETFTGDGIAQRWKIKSWSQLERPKPMTTIFDEIVLLEPDRPKPPLTPFWTGAIFSAVIELVMQNECAIEVLVLVVGYGYIAKQIKQRELDAQDAAVLSGLIFLAITLLPALFQIDPWYHPLAFVLYAGGGAAFARYYPA